jgi:hypothetical protein
MSKNKYSKLISQLAYQRYKKSIVDLITSNGGTVSFVLNKKVDYLVLSDKLNLDTYKCRTAFKIRIPVVAVEFVVDSARSGSLLRSLLKDYSVENQGSLENLKAGKVVSSRHPFRFNEATGQQA